MNTPTHDPDIRPALYLKAYLEHLTSLAAISEGDNKEFADMLLYTAFDSFSLLARGIKHKPPAEVMREMLEGLIPRYDAERVQMFMHFVSTLLNSAAIIAEEKRKGTKSNSPSPFVN